MLNDVMKDLQANLDKGIEAFKRDLTKVRTGRANLAILDGTTGAVGEPMIWSLALGGRMLVLFCAGCPPAGTAACPPGCWFANTIAAAMTTPAMIIATGEVISRPFVLGIDKRYATSML